MKASKEQAQLRFMRVSPIKRKHGGCSTVKRTLETRGLIFLIFGSKTTCCGAVCNNPEQSPHRTHNCSAAKSKNMDSCHLENQ